MHSAHVLPAKAEVAGIRIGGEPRRAARDAVRLRARLLALGLAGSVETSTALGTLHARIRPRVAAAWAPAHDTTRLERHLRHAGPASLEAETVAALLLAPQRMEFPDLDELDSAVRIRLDTVAAARATALTFDCEERRPDACWHRDVDGRFALRPGHDLIHALRRATQPEPDAVPFAFGCYRATEYVMLLAIAQEAARSHPALLDRLRERTERRPIQSREFHDALLREHGTNDAPLPAGWLVPGDRVWFRNPDERSADAEGFEGSWVFYLGGGLFGNFWQRGRPFTLARKCIEIHHWRDALYTDPQGRLRIDESVVERLTDATLVDPPARARVLDRMCRWRDLRGVYADGGCLDRTRECARWVRPATCDIDLLPR